MTQTKVVKEGKGVSSSQVKQLKLPVPSGASPEVGQDFLVSSDSTGLKATIENIFNSGTGVGSVTLHETQSAFQLPEITIGEAHLEQMSPLGMIEAVTSVLTEVAKYQLELRRLINFSIRGDTEKDIEANSAVTCILDAPTYYESAFNVGYKVLVQSLRLLCRTHNELENKTFNSYRVSLVYTIEDEMDDTSEVTLSIFQEARRLLNRVAKFSMDLNRIGVLSRGSFDAINSAVVSLEEHSRSEGQSPKSQSSSVSYTTSAMSHAFSALYVSMLAYSEIHYNIQASLRSCPIEQESCPSIAYLINVDL